MLAVVFDVGHVLYDWQPRRIYERILSQEALDQFTHDVATTAWHVQHDAGRPFAETSAELIARHPGHAALITAWGERFGEGVGPILPGMAALVDELHANAVPLFAITNFSAEFWCPFRAREAAFFDRFRDVVVSGEERLLKPDPAIYLLALKRFGLTPEQSVFVDDRLENVEGARAVGMHARLFTGAATLRGELAELGVPLTPLGAAPRS